LLDFFDAVVVDVGDDVVDVVEVVEVVVLGEVAGVVVLRISVFACVVAVCGLTEPVLRPVDRLPSCVQPASKQAMAAA